MHDTYTCMSITVLASIPGTAVDPLCSIRSASEPSAAWIRSRSVSNSRSHRGSYGTISSIARDCISAPHSAGLLPQQNVFEELDRTRIVRLSEPEHRLLADLGVPIAARDLDQLRHAFVLRHLAEREHRFLLHLGVGIVVNRARDRRERFLAGALREPEERLTADLPALVILRGVEKRRQRRRRLTDRQAERHLVAHLVAGILRNHPRQDARTGIAARRSEPERRIAAQPLGPAWRHEAFERAVGCRHVVKRNGAHRGLRNPILAFTRVGR